MHSLTLDVFCDILGVLPNTLHHWTRAGLLAPLDTQTGYTYPQLAQAYRILDLTNKGLTLDETKNYLDDTTLPQISRWHEHTDALFYLLQKGTDEQIYQRIKHLSETFSGDAFVNSYLRPVYAKVINNKEPNAAYTLTRFHQAIVDYAQQTMAEAYAREATPLFLEAASTLDATEIWLEAIRLSGQGFCVELCDTATDIPATAIRAYVHHLIWCGDGISPLMHWFYRHSLNLGNPILLCGPDQKIRYI